MKSKVETDFIKFLDWCDGMSLSVNTQKTYFMPFAPYKNGLPSYELLQFPRSNESKINIESTQSVKYLGVAIDRHMRWDLHINKLVKKIRSLIIRFRAYAHTFSIRHLKILYHALAGSLLRYGIVAWGSAAGVYVRKLEVTQKWLLKVIFNKRITYPSDDLFCESGFLDIRQMYALELLTFQHRRRFTLEKVEHTHETRYKQTVGIKIPRPDKTLMQRSLTYLGPRMYSLLPSYIVGYNSEGLFKKHTVRWILEQSRARIAHLIELKCLEGW